MKSLRHNASGLNVRLIELSQGIPVVALFYLTCLDLIFVKTAEDAIGYVPRDCCRPICKTSPYRENNNNLMIPNKLAPNMFLQPPPPPLHALPASSLSFVAAREQFIPIRPDFPHSIGLPTHRMSDIGRDNLLQI